MLKHSMNISFIGKIHIKQHKNDPQENTHFVPQYPLTTTPKHSHDIL